MHIKNAKKYLLFIYLSLVGLSLFLIAFALSFSAVRFYDQNDLPPISLSSIDSARRTISEYIPKPFVVYSGSMEPTIKTASLIFTLPTGNYSKGDIITFKRTGSKETITHRIEAVLYENNVNNPEFLTSGDANENIDQGSIGKENIVGKVFLTVPYVGHAVDFAKTPQGFILLVIVPATIIIYEELKTLILHIKSSFGKKRKKKEDLNEKTLPGSNRDFSLSKLSVVIPFVGVFLVFLGITASFFYDSEVSIENVLGVGIYGETPTPTPEPSVTPSPTPTPTPGEAQTLVINEVLPDTSCSQGNIEAQWLELYNGYPFSVNPKNFQITDGVNTIDLVTANNLSIPSGGLLLLTHNTSIFGNGPNACWNDNGTQVGNLGGSLNIDTGDLRILDSDGVTIDTVIWGDNSLTPSQDESIARTPNGFDSEFGTDFEATDFQEYTIPNPGQVTP